MRGGGDGRLTRHAQCRKLTIWTLVDYNFFLGGEGMRVPPPEMDMHGPKRIGPGLSAWWYPRSSLNVTVRPCMQCVCVFCHYTPWRTCIVGLYYIIILRPNTSILRPNTSILHPNTSILRPYTSILRPYTSTIRPNTMQSTYLQAANHSIGKVRGTCFFFFFFFFSLGGEMPSKDLEKHGYKK